MARSRKDSYLAIALLLAVALFLALTNPGQGDFKAWMEIQGASSAKKGSTGGGAALLGALGKAAGSIKSSAYTRSNLGLVSLYRSTDSSGEVLHSYLGLARTFIKLK